jgi:hypothetical protein
MAWIGNHEPPQFRVIADSRQGERLIGEHNVLAERLGEAGFGVTGILHELKLGLWKRLHPFTALPERFGDKEDSELKESLYYERLAIHMPGQDKGDPPVYGTLDTGLPNNALDDPEVLKTLTEHIGLPILMLGAAEETLFAIDEQALRNEIARCVAAVEARSR